MPTETRLSVAYRDLWAPLNIVQMRSQVKRVWHLRMNTHGVVPITHPISGEEIAFVGQKMYCKIDRTKRESARTLFGSYVGDPEWGTEHGEPDFRALILGTIKGFRDAAMAKYVRGMIAQGRRVVQIDPWITNEEFQELRLSNPGTFFYVPPQYPDCRCQSSVDIKCAGCGRDLSHGGSFKTIVWELSSRKLNIEGALALDGAKIHHQVVNWTTGKPSRVSRTPREILRANIEKSSDPEDALFRHWFIRKHGTLTFCSEGCANKHRKNLSGLKNKITPHGQGDCIHWKPVNELYEARNIAAQTGCSEPIAGMTKACELRGTVDTFWESVIEHALAFNKYEGMYAGKTYTVQSDHVFSPERDHLPSETLVSYRQPNVWDLREAGFVTRKRLLGSTDRFSLGETEEYQEWEDPPDWIHDVIDRREGHRDCDFWDERFEIHLREEWGCDPWDMNVVDEDQTIWMNDKHTEFYEPPQAVQVEEGCIKSTKHRYEEMIRGCKMEKCPGYTARRPINVGQLMNASVAQLTKGFIPLTVVDPEATQAHNKELGIEPGSKDWQIVYRQDMWRIKVTM